MSKPAAKQSKEQSKPNASITLDAANCGKALWLIKLPKSLASAWEKSSEENVAKIFITKDANNLKVHMKSTIPLDTDIPNEYDVLLRPVTDQKMAVISQPLDGSTSALHMEGHFNRRADARPSLGGSSAYLKMKRSQIKKALLPTRTAVQIDSAEVKYKPISAHAHNIEAEVQRKKPESKKLRDDREVVTERLLAAFEQHQFYNIKDLQTITNQPVGYLKDILRELCVYNTKNPHRNMWELKPEYRHYK